MSKIVKLIEYKYEIIKWKKTLDINEQELNFATYWQAYIFRQSELSCKQACRNSFYLTIP